MINMEEKVNQHTYIYYSWRKESINEVEKNLKIQFKKTSYNQKKPWGQDSSAKKCWHIIIKIDIYPSNFTRPQNCNNNLGIIRWKNWAQL